MPGTAHAAPFTHVFWDMGGTLVNTYPQLDSALASVVRRAGHPITDHDVAILTRRSTGEAISTLSRRYDIAEADLRQAEASLKTTWLTAPPPAMPGIHEVMAAVRGLNLVVTHRERASAESLLTCLNITVDDLLCAPDGYPRKPDPSMYVALLERHGLSASDCIAVGDRPIDAVAAGSAGMAAVMLRTPQVPLENDADFQIETLDELLTLLA